MTATAQLDLEMTRLAEALWAAVTALDGGAAHELCERLGNAARDLRQGDYPGGRRGFAEQIAQLTNDDLEDVARAETLWCHLMNIAEERQRLRMLRSRGDQQLDGITAAIDQIVDSGGDEAALRSLFDRALVMPVITAHPTEARRRSSLDHLGRISTLLDELDTRGRARSGNLLASEVLAFHGTEHSRARRPTPLDEVENMLYVFQQSLLDVTPRIYRTLEDHLAARLGGTWRLPTFLRWGTWVGGDRDGNPNVTASITRGAFARHRTTIIERYLADLVELGRSLSVSALRAQGPLDELQASLEVEREQLPEVAAHARSRTIHEPWREKLWYIQARLKATLDHRYDGYLDAEAYHDDLELLDRSLRAAGFGVLADQRLRDALRRVDVFGFHLATLDVRQHSGVHDQVTAELLARGGRAGYLELDEAGRRAMLREVLARPLRPARDWDGVSPAGKEILETLEVVGRARRELGPRACERYVVSFTRDVSDLLEVVYLARVAGLAPGELRPVPLLEQLEDLARAGEIADELIADEIIVRELAHDAHGKPELEVMIGYSDSGKQIGYVAAQVTLRQAQLDLAASAARSNYTLTVFHGRGGAIGRGGGPENEAIRAQPPAAVNGRLRVTEQGETVTARYGNVDVAERELELMLSAVLVATTEHRGQDDAADEPLLRHAAAAAKASYLALTSNEDRLARYTIAATPIEDVAHLPLGSRPASRKPKLTLGSLRAIPWVFSWSQSRHGIPGWFGMGTAIAALAEQHGPDAGRELAARSPFFRAMIRNCELSLVRSDIDVAREYARLADDDAATLFDQIAAEHARTVAGIQQVLGITTPLATRPYLAESIARRNSTLDVLSHTQIEALRRRRAGGDVEFLGRVMFTTIAGIAAGLQTAG